MNLSDVIKKVRPSAGTDAEELLRWIVRHGKSRGVLNRVYNRLSYGQKQEWYRRFAKMFRCSSTTVEPGVWTVDFCGRSLRFPLANDTMWLDWDAALSALGHEVEIKKTYEALLASRDKPACFVDIGSNYGLHFLLFLVHGVDVFPFEPNPGCQAYVDRVLSLNALEATVHESALGPDEAMVDLHYPDRETWLGTIDPGTRKKLADENLRTLRVSCVRLDDFSAEHRVTPDLIKIDVEGSELGVLEGARTVLRAHRPILIIESWSGRREFLSDLLGSVGYQAAALPLTCFEGVAALERREFLASKDNNFAGMPSERCA